MVIATTSNKVLKFIGTDFEVLEEGRGLYYGLARTEDGFIVASRNHNLITQLYYYIVDREGRIELYRSWEVPPVADVHEITYVNRKVYCTNTKGNDVISFDIDTEHTKHESWLGCYSHINSIEFANDSFYITGLDHGEIGRVHITGKTLYRESRQCCGPHTIKYQYGKIWICESAICKFSSFYKDTLKKEAMWSVCDQPKKYMTRGLAWDENLFYCGLSPRGNRIKRHILDAAIFVRNRLTDEETTVKLEGEGQVLDLLAI